MTDAASSAPCPDCGAAYESSDNYCRRCGMYLVAVRPPTPATRTETALEPVRASLPAPVKKAATALAIGTALQIGVGLAGKYLASQGGKQAVTAAARPGLRRRKNRGKNESRAVADPLEDAAAVSETVLIRRVWVRK